MIPKIIHYCWFGKNPKPNIVKKCIESWKKYCPDWEIKEWNESNFDVSVHPYIKEAYERKKWAFVSDVVRLLIVYEYGGVYLDTDVELCYSLSKEITRGGAFFVFESNRNIATGLGFGAEKRHYVVRKMLEYYEGKHFVGKDGKEHLNPCPKGNTESLEAVCKDFKRNGITQKISDIMILSFSEYSKIAKHYGTATWVEDPKRTGGKYHDMAIKNYLRSPKAFRIVEKLGIRSTEIYTFLVYDFLEFGIKYYIRKIVSKFSRRKLK